MADRLLVLVPHEHTHAPRSILEQARKLGPDVTDGKTALLNGQSMGRTKSELHQSLELTDAQYVRYEFHRGKGSRTSFSQQAWMKSHNELFMSEVAPFHPTSATSRMQYSSDEDVTKEGRTTLWLSPKNLDQQMRMSSNKKQSKHHAADCPHARLGTTGKSLQYYSNAGAGPSQLADCGHQVKSGTNGEGSCLARAGDSRALTQFQCTQTLDDMSTTLHP